MRKIITSLLSLPLMVQSSFGQTQSSAVRLDSCAEVTNMIIFRNPGVKSISASVPYSHSVMDSMPKDMMFDVDRSIRLIGSPFVNGYRINSSSPAFNRGNNEALREGIDTLDLDYSNRLRHERCPQVDMGAYEYQVVATTILAEPADLRLCAGTHGLLSVGVEGENLTYQWRKNGVNMPGETSSTLRIFGRITDEGLYSVHIIGDCCEATSREATVTIDRNPVLNLIADHVTVQPHSDYDLQHLVSSSSVGHIVWFAGTDLSTPITNTLMTNVIETQTFLAVATNGACADVVSKTAMIVVSGMPCILRTYPDVQMCLGDSVQLLMDTAFVNYEWFVLGNPQELEKFSWYKPAGTVQLVAKSTNGLCRDTMTITVYEVQFYVMEDKQICGEHGGTEVQLVALPQADAWYRLNENHEEEYIGSGLPFVMIENNSRNIFVAHYHDGVCPTTKPVEIMAAPPKFKLFAQDTTICEGEPVHLTTNIDDSEFDIVWLIKGSSAPLTNLFVRPSVTTTYQAWIYNASCGDVFEEVTVNVQQKPMMRILNSPVSVESVVYLTSAPLASYWMLADGTRISNPITLSEQEEIYTGWYQSGVCLVSASVAIVFEYGRIPSLTIEITSNDYCLYDASAAVFITEETTGPYRFLWNTGDTATVIAGLSPGYHSVMVYDGKGDSVFGQVYILQRPAIQISSQINAAKDNECSNGSMEVNVSGGMPFNQGGYIFEFTDPNENRTVVWNIADYVFQDAAAGVYTLTVYDERGCTKDTTLFIPCTSGMMPNIFITPNGDGKNDYVKIRNIHLYPDNRVIIFNAYGETVNEIRNYDNNDPARRWGGRNSKGVMLPDGVYYYIVEAKDFKPMSGWIYMTLTQHR
jgi:gliding motility-associated-like protein